MNVFSSIQMKTHACIPPFTKVEGVVCEVSNGENVVYINNGDQSFDQKNLRGSVGTKMWTIVTECSFTDRVTTLEKELKTLNKKFNSMENGFVIPRIRNVAAQILLFLVKSQPKFPKPTSTWFNDSGSVFEDCSTELEWTLKGFKTSADRIINERNNDAHADSVDELEKMVIEANEFLDSFPSIRGKCKNECRVIDGFSVIKKYIIS